MHRIIKCPKCESKLLQSAEKCPNCGEILKPYAITDDARNAPFTLRKRKPWIPIAVPAAAVAVLLVIVLLATGGSGHAQPIDGIFRAIHANDVDALLALCDEGTRKSVRERPELKRKLDQDFLGQWNPAPAGYEVAGTALQKGGSRAVLDVRFEFHEKGVKMEPIKFVFVLEHGRWRWVGPFAGAR